MDWQFYLLLLAGSVIQFSLLLDFSDWKWRDLYKVAEAAAISVFFSLVLESKKRSQRSISDGLLFTFIIFIGGLALLFKERIVPKINERVLLIVGLSTWYLIFSNRAAPWFTIIYSGIMALIIMNSLLRLKPTRAVQVWLFVWYFVSIITATLINFDWNILEKVFLKNLTHVLPPTETIVYGMTFSFIIIHAAFLFNFIPGKRERFYLQRMSRYADLLDQHYDESSQMRVVETIIIVFGLGTLLVLNLFYSIVPDNFVLVLIFLAGFLERVLKTKQIVGAATVD